MLTLKRMLFLTVALFSVFQVIAKTSPDKDAVIEGKVLFLPKETPQVESKPIQPKTDEKSKTNAELRSQ